MEGFQWVRIGAIIALILGAVYVLLPTIVGETAADRIRSQAEQVDAPSTSQRAELDFELRVVEGESGGGPRSHRIAACCGGASGLGGRSGCKHPRGEAADRYFSGSGARSGLGPG